MKKGKKSHHAQEPRESPAVTRAVPDPVVAWVLASAALAYTALVLLSSVSPRSSTWGVDTPGYLKSPLRILVLLIMMTGAGLVLFSAVRRPSSSVDAPIKPRQRQRSWTVTALAILLGTIILWVLRVRNAFLGDQMVWSQNLRTGMFPYYSEPLAALLWRGYVLLMRGVGVSITDQALAILPVLLGIVAGSLSWRISGYLARDRSSRLLSFALIGTLGTAQLYAGYIESYGIFSLAVLLYLLAGLRLACGKGSALALGLALVLAIATHLFGVFLIPSYVALVSRTQKGALRRLGLLLVPIAAAAGVGWLIGFDIDSIAGPFKTLGVAVESSARTAGRAIPFAALVLRPIRDFGNLLLLVMPLPLLLIAGSLVARWRGKPRRPGYDRLFLAWAAASGAVATLVLVIPGSPAQDWDLLSVAVLPVAIWSIQPWFGSGLPTTRVLGAGLVALALAPLLAFVLVNADEQAGVRRFKTIIASGTIISRHERAYANEKLVKYYTARKDFDSVFVYAQRARDAEPGNTRYWGNIGTALYNLHRYEEAAKYYEVALARGSDRPEVYYNLGLCYTRMGRFQDAVKDIRTAIDLSGEQPQYLNGLALAMLGAGDSAGAHRVWTYVLKQWPGYPPTVRAFDYYFGKGGAGPAPAEPG